MVRKFLAIRPNDGVQPMEAFSSVDRMMRDMLRAFGDFSSEMRSSETANVIATPRGDFYRKDGTFVAELEIPGIDPEKVDLKVYEDRMTLTAEKSDEKTVDEGNYFRSERYYGTISRSVQFPAEVDPDSAKASFKNGVLTVEVAEKTQVERMKKVDISA